METFPIPSSVISQDDQSVSMGDFSTANSVNQIEKKKVNFFLKLFKCGCMSAPNTLGSISTQSPFEYTHEPLENMFGNVYAKEGVADNFSFFDSKSSKD